MEVEVGARVLAWLKNEFLFVCPKMAADYPEAPKVWF